MYVDYNFKGKNNFISLTKIYRRLAVDGMVFTVILIKKQMNTILNFMKRNYKILVVILCLSVVFFAFNSNAKKELEEDLLDK